MTVHVRGLAVLLAKVTVSAGLMTFLLVRADLGAIRETLAAAAPGWLAVAFLMFFTGYVITAARWRLLLAAQGVTARLGELVQSFAIAVFFNNLLPSTIGGDAFRMYDSWRLGANRAESISVVLVDRILGLLALMSVAAVALLFAPEVSGRTPLIGWLLAAVMAGIAAGLWLVFGRAAPRLMKLTRRSRIFAWPMARVSSLVSGLAPFRNRPDVLWRALALSVLLQTNVIVHFIVLAHALDVPIAWPAMFIIVPLALLLMILPVSVNGIGLREAVFVFLFGLYGIDREQAIAFAWTSFAMIVAQGMLGGIVFATRRARLHRQVEAQR